MTAIIAIGAPFVSFVMCDLALLMNERAIFLMEMRCKVEETIVIMRRATQRPTQSIWYESYKLKLYINIRKKGTNPLIATVLSLALEIFHTNCGERSKC